MRIGYLKVIETLRLLTHPKLVKGVAQIEVTVRTGKTYSLALDTITLDQGCLVARVYGDHRWIQIPADELVGIAVEFEATDETTLPNVLAKLRPKPLKGKALRKALGIPNDDEEATS